MRATPGGLRLDGIPLRTRSIC